MSLLEIILQTSNDHYLILTLLFIFFFLIQSDLKCVILQNLIFFLDIFFYIFTSSNRNKPVLYHYYEKRYDECWMYTQHETRMKTGHRYLTEKAIFKQWAQMFNITFKVPSWDMTDVNASDPIKSPFIEKMDKLKKRPKR